MTAHFAKRLAAVGGLALLAGLLIGGGLHVSVAAAPHASPIVDRSPSGPVIRSGGVQAAGVITQARSFPEGGTSSQDWGDYDRDGYLDLAIGSTNGITIYRNQGGTSLVLLAANATGPVHDVRWADVNGDGALELATVGYNASGGQYQNRLYTVSNGQLSQVGAFASKDQLLRVAAIQTVNGAIDLIASTSRFNVECGVLHFRNNGLGQYGAAECISQRPAAALGAGDIDRDGDADLVVGQFPQAVTLFINRSGMFTETASVPANAVTFDNAPFMPYSFAWGDYDGDGYFDLAAAFPFERQIRVYRNVAGLAPDRTFRLSGFLGTQRFQTPFALEWADVNGNGQLDLIVADDAPRAYYDVAATLGGSPNVQALGASAPQAARSARAVALNNTDLNLVFGYPRATGALYATFSGHLATQLTALSGSSAANSVSWGDANYDGFMDLLVGTADPALPTILYRNSNGQLSTSGTTSLIPNINGASRVTLGDIDRDGRLDAVVAVSHTTGGGVTVYGSANPSLVRAAWTEAAGVTAVALGDYNGDGWLDVLVGLQSGAVRLYRNGGGQIVTAAPFAVLPQSGAVRALAWADVNRDGWLDFAVGTTAGYARVYVNDSSNAFADAFTTAPLSPTLAVGWGDADRDGYADLAVGTDQGGLFVYRNNAGQLTATDVYTLSLAPSQISSVAWGDWDNDGLPELAVGRRGEPNLVYANSGDAADVAQYQPLWASSDAGDTTDLAWGDVNNDGYLDLAVSHVNSNSGVYVNPTVLPWRLPNPPAYLSIARPGKTGGAYLYSTSELLSGPFEPTTTVYYTAYNPSGAPITTTHFEYSLDGSQWLAATPAVTPSLPLSRPGSFAWNAQLIQPPLVGDDLHFRIRVVERAPVGPVQRAATSAVSPPFRVRATTCVWPSGPAIAYSPQGSILTQTLMVFTGTVSEASGAITYRWDFGDGQQATGKKVTHQFAAEGQYIVQLTVEGEACPVTRPVYANVSIQVGTGRKTYLPIMLRSNTAAVTTPDRPAAPIAPARPARTTATCEPLPIDPEAGITTLPALVGAGHHGQLVLNADGTRLAFWSTGDVATVGNKDNPDGNVELFYGQIDRLNRCITIAQLTDSEGGLWEGLNLSPSINAAGNRVAFFSDADVTGGNADRNFEIFVARLTSPTEYTLVQITDTTDRVNAYPAINGDGTRVAFASNQNWPSLNTLTNDDENQEIYIATLGSGLISYTQVTSTPVGQINDQPVLTSNGRRVVFVSGDSLDTSGSVQEVYLADLDAADEVQVRRVSTTARDTVSYRPQLNVIGTRLLYALRMPAQFSLRLMDVSGSNSTQLSLLSGTDRATLNTGTGTRLARSTLDGQTVSMFDADTFNATTLMTCGAAGCAYPALSGDGARAAFISGTAVYLAYFEPTDLVLSMASPPAQVAAGERLTYTMVLVNNGPGPVDGVTLSGTLPSGAALVSTPSSTGGGVCQSGNAALIKCEVPVVSVDTPVTVTAVAQVEQEQTTPLELTLGARGWQHDTDLSNNVYIVKTTVNVVSDLFMSKSAPATVAAGDRLTYTLYITNTGPSAAKDLVISDVLTDALTFRVGSQSNTLGLDFVQSGQGLKWTKNSMPKGSGSIQFVADVAVDVPVNTEIANKATIDASTLPTPGSAEATTTTTAQAALSVRKQLDQPAAPIVAGGVITYRVTVINSGPSLAHSVRLTDVLPSGLSVRSGPAECAGSDTTLTCDLGDIAPPAGQVVITFTADITSSASGPVTNTAYASSLGATTAASGSLSNTVTTRADLQLTLTRSTAPITTGATLTYTVEYVNAGLSNAVTTRVTDTLPTSVQFGGVVSMPSGVSVQHTGRFITWTVGTLPALADGQIVFTGTLISGVSGQNVINSARISAATTDPNPNNNLKIDTGTIAALLRWLALWPLSGPRT